jgi:ParB/RepB/Spo0J family partition protein
MMITAVASLEWIALDAITASIQPRNLRAASVARLVESMERSGFLPQYPIVVSVLDDGYRLLAGHHRVAAAQQLNLETIPALLYTDLTSDEEWQLAVATNRAHEAATLPTFVDDAELVWKLAETGKKQDVIAEIMGWSRSQVAQYSQLHKLSAEAWQVIVTTFQDECNNQENISVTGDVTTVTKSVFTEGILREIVLLLAHQQLELVKLLVKDPKAKGAYKTQAEKYRGRNALADEAKRRLKALPADVLARALQEIDKGHYDAEWKAQKQPGPRFLQLMQQLLDEQAQKQNYTLHCARFQDLLDTIPDASLDWIITDPPYGREFLPEYADLASWAARKLKPGASLIVLCGQSYLPDLLQSLSVSLTYHWCLAYLTPGGQAVQLWQREVNTFWKPVLWFVNGTYEGKWVGDVTRSAVNDNDKRLHTWGQSESGMADLVERLTYKGETICDPFMGAGTTGVVALRSGRKFVGIEVDPDAFAVAEKRLQDDHGMREDR